MADYNFDEVKRKEKEKIEKKISGDWPKSVQIGKEKISFCVMGIYKTILH